MIDARAIYEYKMGVITGAFYYPLWWKFTFCAAGVIVEQVKRAVDQGLMKLFQRVDITSGWRFGKPPLGHLVGKILSALIPICVCVFIVDHRNDPDLDIMVSENVLCLTSFIFSRG